MKTTVLVLFAFLIVFPIDFFAADPSVSPIKEMKDVYVPMRDGIKLSADVWLPAREGCYPVILIRTPYLKNSPFARYPEMARFFTRHGYVFMAQDVRGRGGSEGIYRNFHQESRDGYDTIEWIARQAWCSGRIGMMGGSYSGTVQWLAARERPPHLCCLVSTAAWADPFEEGPYHQGVFNVLFSLLSTIITSREVSIDISKVNWSAVLKNRPLLTLDEVLGAKMPRYRQILEHKTLDDYWKEIILTEADYRKIDIPALHLTGWFDVDQIGALIFWRGMRTYSPACDLQFLMIGPWEHGHIIYGGGDKVGEIDIPEEYVVDFDAFLNIHRVFFDRFMKAGDKPLDLPRARIFMTGTGQWRDLDSYPPPALVEKRLYLHSRGRANSLSGDGTLSPQLPGNEPPDCFIFDPQHPISHMKGDKMHALDNRTIEEHDNILVYTGQVLKSPVEILGQVNVELFAASDSRDTDFVVKLLDVYPDGRAVNLGPFGKGFIRARYRNGYDREIFLTPNRTEGFRIKLFDIGHTFLPGHKIRLEISSSAVPYLAPNSNTGNPVATDTEWKIARQTIFHTRTYPSAVILPVVSSN
jgi:putative CocE/NonD family hydrolase